MKLAFLCPTLFGAMGGLEVCTHNVALRLAGLGHQVTVLTAHLPPAGLVPPYAVGRMPRFFLSTRGYPLSKLWVRAWAARAQRAGRFEAWMVCGGFPYGALLGGWFRRAGVPGVLRCAGDDIQISPEYDYGVRRAPKADRMVRAEYPRFDACVAITDTVRREYLALGIAPERIRLIPNGADVARIAATPPDAGLRARLGVPAGARLLLSVGRAHAKKGYHLVFPALARLLSLGLDAHWLFVGKGCRAVAEAATAELRGRLHALEEISFGAGFELPGAELVAIYRAADCFVMPSLLETFGIVLVEAMAAGLPVACFDAPGVRDVFSPACGSMVPLGDAQALADAAAGLLASGLPDAAAATAWVKRHSWDRVAREYLALFESLLA